MIDCPDDATLASVLGGTLAASRAGEVFVHLDTCAGCQARIETLSAEVDQALRAPVDAPVDPEQLSRMTAALVDGTPRPRRRRAARLRPLLALAALALGGALVFGLGRRFARPAPLPDLPAPGPGSDVVAVPDAGLPPRIARRLQLERELLALETWERAHPRDLAGRFGRWRALRREARGTRYELLATRGLAGVVEAERERLFQVSQRIKGDLAVRDWDRASSRLVALRRALPEPSELGAQRLQSLHVRVLAARQRGRGATFVAGARVDPDRRGVVAFGRARLAEVTGVGVRPTRARMSLGQPGSTLALRLPRPPVRVVLRVEHVVAIDRRTGLRHAPISVFLNDRAVLFGHCPHKHRRVTRVALDPAWFRERDNVLRVRLDADATQQIWMSYVEISDRP